MCIWQEYEILLTAIQIYGVAIVYVLNYFRHNLVQD